MPDCPPIGHALAFYPDCRVRFHSLPGSKRYADTEAEYQIVLHRYNTILTELFAGQTVRVITVSFVHDAGPGPIPEVDPHALNPGSRPWTRVREDEEFEPGGTMHVHVAERPWSPGVIDPLLRAVADDECFGAIITDLDFRYFHHSYDGGADVILPTPGERDRLKNDHADWLPRHPTGR